MALKEEKEFAVSGKQKDSVGEETSAVSGTRVTIVQNRHQKPLHFVSHEHQEVEVRREKGASEVGVQSEKSNRQPCTDFLKSFCTQLLCDFWHPPRMPSL